MSTVKNPTEKENFRIEGKVRLEGEDCKPADMKLVAYAFNALEVLLGKADVNEQGGFSLALNISRQEDVELIIGPQDDPYKLRQSSAYVQKFSAKDWVGQSGQSRLIADIFLPRDIWWPWRPVRICVSGHVRKIQNLDGQTDICPVPFVKVEIFDVDREFCWWPWLRKWWDVLLDRPVIRIPDLLKDRPFPKPFPEPDPVPDLRFSRIGAGMAESLNPQPLPPRAFASAMHTNPGDLVSFNPQPDPPANRLMSSQAALSRAGEVSALSASLASRLEKLTLTSKLAPWHILPHCFYSKQLVCETYTDCKGYFRCCFSWPSFHFRRGRLRFDARPDIIIRVTQIINGVKTVIYMDPYTSTRWNVTNAHIDLFLDNEEINCGHGNCPGSLPGNLQASMLQIGSDPVWQINQSNGMYTVPPVTNAAYGGLLYIRGDFSADLKSGSPKRYYKLSYAKAGTSDFTPIKTPLSVLRAAFPSPFTEYLLGPQPDGGPLAGLYEVQDTAHWWSSGGPGGAGMLIGLWDTSTFESDEGTYVLRMELFDDAGNKITTAQFPDHGGNGSGIDPDPVPVSTGHLDLKVHVDNKPMTFSLTTPAINDCGVIPWSSVPPLDFYVHAAQENGRVNSWSLQYTKGVNPTRLSFVGGSMSYASGIGLVNQPVNGNILLSEPVTVANPNGELQSTCAFALILNAQLHVRGNWGFIWAEPQAKVYAIAIEKCPQCPDQ